MADQQDNETRHDDRIPMTTFGAGERIKESLHHIGDITLFRPFSFLEILVGIPLCFLFCYTIVYPLFGGNVAIAAFVVTLYFAPKGLVLAEAKAGRPLVAEAAATVTFLWNLALGANLYQGTHRLDRFNDRHQRRRLKQMLADEDKAYTELTESRTTTETGQ